MPDGEAGADPAAAAHDGRSRQRPILVVLGPPESGIALCLAVLGLMGLEPLDEPAVRGPDGARPIAALHADLLSVFDRGLSSPLHDMPLPPDWWTEPRARPAIAAMTATLRAALDGARRPVLGGSLFSRLLPAWMPVFAALDLEPRFVLCLREPSQTALALETSSGLRLEAGAYRALDYTAHALQDTAGHARCFIRHEDWFADRAVPLGRLRSLAGIGEEPRTAALAEAIEAVIGPPPAVAAPAGVDDPFVHRFFKVALSHAAAPGADAAGAARLHRAMRAATLFRGLLAPFAARLRASEDAAAAATARAAALATSLDQARRMAGEGAAARRHAERGRKAALAGLQRERDATAAAARLTQRLQQAVDDHAIALSDTLAQLAAAQAALRAERLRPVWRPPERVDVLPVRRGPLPARWGWRRFLFAR